MRTKLKISKFFALNAEYVASNLKNADENLVSSLVPFLIKNE